MEGRGGDSCFKKERRKKRRSRKINKEEVRKKGLTKRPSGQCSTKLGGKRGKRREKKECKVGGESYARFLCGCSLARQREEKKAEREDAGGELREPTSFRLRKQKKKKESHDRSQKRGKPNGPKKKTTRHRPHKQMQARPRQKGHAKLQSGEPNSTPRKKKRKKKGEKGRWLTVKMSWKRRKGKD